MHTADNTKIVWLINPQVITDDDDPVGAYGDANPNSCDTLGWSRAKVVVRVGATDIALTALGVYSGAAAASGADDATYAAVSGAAASGTSGDGRLPTATDDNKTFAFNLDLKNDDIARYLALDCTVGNGTAGGYVTAFVLLSEPEETPSSDSERGLEWELDA